MNPGGTVTATVEITVPPGTAINSILWTVKEGVDPGITGETTDTATLTLAAAEDYKTELVHYLQEPPVTEDELPPNVPLPPGDFPGGLPDRLMVVGINPLALERASIVVLEVEVDTAVGLFTDEVEVHTHVPWKVASGLRNVPTNVGVLLQAADGDSHSWTMHAPAGSSATLFDANTRYPYFTPDVSGLYELTVNTAAKRGKDPEKGVDEGESLHVYAGRWRGAIADQDIDGRPVGDTACTFCHNGDLAGDEFTDWAQTGHAEIFTNNLNNSTHYGPQCFSCHTVGFDPEADNGGIDEAADYQAFLDSGLINHPGDNWTEVLADFPDTAAMANAQCEACHGPQDSLAHGFGSPPGDPRVDLSSDVCATCHGEPLRHARFQQWQLSGHANYDVAMDEGDSGNCSRCHTGNGFLEWLPILLDDDPETDPLDNVQVTWEPDEVHPQTCATCHDPHAAGTTSGSNTNATVRISGDTPPLIAGFQVLDAGRGAICMTCHNSRRGLRNDSVWDTFSTGEKARAPHGSAQADMVAGENAYLVDVGTPGGHANVEDSCIACHMESTPPPAALSYNQSGTNHTFFADVGICSDCHSPRLLASDVQGSIQHLSDMVEDLLEDALYELIADLTEAGNTVDINGDLTITDPSVIDEIQFGEYRGRQSVSLTLGDGTEIGPVRVTDIDVFDGAMANIGTLYDFAEDDMMKAGWNWLLVHNDGSLGLHNPFYAQGVLIAARDALVNLQGGGGEMTLHEGDGTFGKNRTGNSMLIPTPFESKRSRSK